MAAPITIPITMFWFEDEGGATSISGPSVSSAITEGF